MSNQKQFPVSPGDGPKLRPKGALFNTPTIATTTGSAAVSPAFAPLPIPKSMTSDFHQLDLEQEPRHVITIENLDESDFDEQSLELLAAGHAADEDSSEEEHPGSMAGDFNTPLAPGFDCDHISVVSSRQRQPSIQQSIQHSLHNPSQISLHNRSQVNPFVGKAVTKEAIVRNWLPRYTGVPLHEFGEYILLCNFHKYVSIFAEMFAVPVRGQDKPITSATANNITIMNFGMGSAAAATCCDLLSAIRPKAVLFLGKCGGLKRSIPVGSLILPIAAIRGEGTSDEYLDAKVPALPAFALQKAISETIDIMGCYNDTLYTGQIYTTNQRVWEHRNDFKQRLRECRAIGVDMETATLFVVCFANKIPAGALLLVSDKPLIQEGIKTAASDDTVTKNYVDNHLLIGIEALKHLQEKGTKVKHLKF